MKKNFLVFVCTLVLLTGCNSSQTDELYPRLDANNEASKIHLVDGEKEIIEFYKLMFPEYELESVCEQELLQVEKLNLNIEGNILYYEDPNLGCNAGSSGRAYIKKGQVFIFLNYQGLEFSDISVANAEHGCFEKISGSTNDDGTYIFSAYIYDSEIYTVTAKGGYGYCPDMKAFRNEYDQLANYIYDSFLLIDHSKEITK